MEDIVKAGRVKPHRRALHRRALMLEPRRLARSAAIVMALVMPAGLLSAPAAFAEPPNSQRPTVADRQEPVAGRDLKVRPRKADTAEPGPAARAAWPKPGSAEVDVPAKTSAARSSTGAAAVAKADGLPIEVLAPAGTEGARSAAPAAGRVRVQVLDPGAARAAGVDGLAFTVARTDASAPGQVRLRLDYSKFEQAFGGAYGARLKLMRLPQCALVTPGKPECRTPVPLEASNNGEARTLTAEVEAAPATTSGSPAVASQQGNATLLVAAAGSESSQGDYQATSLEASATWSAGGNSGGFSWSYPMRVPPVPSGLSPKVEISYSSASVDGRTANANGQPSWVGQGFDLWPGYIERSYKSCEDDGAPKDEWGNSPGDQCWGYDNATVTWNGKGGELIKASDGTWRTKNDDGTKFEKLTSSSIDNGDDNGEYWKVTTTDGTQYFFGLNRAPGWVSGKPETNSAWTAPVFGDDSGEPCHASAGFKESWCQQAYRWNLDYVVDPSGNAILYTYVKETNHYGRNLKPEDETPYVRGGYLETISYGLRKDDLFAKAPAQVTFTTSERCLPDDAFDCAPSKIGDNPDRWWDVPWDLNCNSGQECKETHGGTAPTFWSRKRLTKITTQIIKPDASGYRPVDSWSLNHSWGLADVERDLRLEEIEHSGHVVTGEQEPVTLPKVTFNHVQKDNRLDKSGDDILPYVRYRVGAIYDEAGGQIEVNYSDTDCSLSDLPTPETNATRCMPVIWTPPGREDPMTDWFHKYVVTSVTQVDRTGLSPNMTTKYDYVGGAAWHFDDDDGLTKEKEKTWSQWRGYGHVRTFTGDPANPATQTDAYFLRGMDGDRKNKDGGEKSVTVSDGEGGTHTDHDALAGFTLRTVQYTEPGGSVHTKTVNTPWRVQTASRTRSWGTVTANVVAPDTTRTWTAKDGGGWTETKTDNTYKSSGPGVGRITSSSNLSDVTTGTDDKCTRTTYTDNTDAWMVSFPSRVETVSVACTATPERPADVVSDGRTYYDNGGFGDAPVKGRVTKAEKLAEYETGTSRYVTEAATVYDTYGRPTKVTDAAGQSTTTAYTDTHGLNTKIVATTPPATPGNSATALTSETNIEPAWGAPVSKIDKSNRDLRTDLVYDPLGRLAQVWLPNRSKLNNPHPNYEYDYQIVKDQIVAVTTKTLTATGGQRLSKIELLDGWLRPRQTQAPGQTGRLISDVFYDNRGQVVKTYAAYPAADAPEPVLFGVGTPGDVETQTRTSYDGLGRNTVVATTTGNGEQPEQELWRTTYTYGGGNRTSVTPPDGGTPTTEIVNALGQVTERRQHKAETPAGEYDATRFTYTPAGEIASVTDPSGNEWTTTYDLRGRKTRTTDPDKGTTTYTYDDLDRPVSVTDARGKTLVTTYDGLGRTTTLREDTASGPTLASWAYDTAPFGKGKLASSTRHTPNGNYTTAVRHYDQLGRADVIATTIPASQGPLAGTYINGTSYNLDGTVQSQGQPGGGGLPTETLVYTYDDLQRPVRMATNNVTYVGDVVYTDTDKPQIIELGGQDKRVWQTFAYQYGTQRLDRARTTREGIAGYARSAVYNYTDSGNITSITDTSHDGVDNQCFTYDHLQRLTQAWSQTAGTCATEPTDSVIGGPAPYWHSFTYDKAGNRTGETRHGIGGETDVARTYTYAQPGNGNRLETVAHTGPTGDRTAAYGYDATGNTTSITTTEGPTNSTQTFDWNTEGELAKVTENGNDVTYVYDADGNRLIRKDPTGTTLYLPGGTELRAPTGATTATGTRYYTFAEQTIAMRASDGTLTYMAGDHQGTAQLAVDATTQQLTTRRFTPFGTIRGLDEDATWPGDKGFLGGTQDPTGLTHLSAREYNPETGRFISVDPLMDLADQQQMNGYTYSNNTPISNSDPSGLMHVGGTQCGIIASNPCNASKGSSSSGSGYFVDSSGDSTVPYPNAFGFGGAWDNAPVKKRYTHYRQIIQNFRDYPFNPKDNPEEYKLQLQAQQAFCLEFSTDPLCGPSGPPDPHAVLPIIGMMGPIGPVADVADAGLYAKEGAWGDAAGSLGSMVPGPGDVLALLRLRKAAKACSSFVPETLVLMADGSRKHIEDVEIGDEVVATDPETGETSAEPVLATITTEGDKNLVQLTIDPANPSTYLATTDGPDKSGSLIRVPDASKSGVLIATDSHPFWVAGDIDQWVEAAELEPGMWLRTSAGTYVQITAIEQWSTSGQRVHNLTISRLHTYYTVVDGRPVLVHNLGGPGGAGSPSKGDFGVGELIHKLRKDGYVIRGTEISAKAHNGVTVRFDVVAEKGGVISVYDAKTGPRSEFSKAQGRRGGYQSIEDRGGTWTGRNARQAGLSGSFGPTPVKIDGYKGYPWSGACR
ncbi:RHS repeat-associated core domain-containing protein [Actinomadura sp. LOL_016]|uniref:RHS repeat-associated core domain-containing protein n=1 Tax=Actinomadura sp. LOL_016 TaxID=3345411 RepID=UPI003A874CB6